MKKVIAVFLLVLGTYFAFAQSDNQEVTVPEDVDAFVQADMMARLDALTRGQEEAAETEEHDLMQKIDLGDGEYALIINDHDVVLFSPDGIFGLSAFSNEPDALGADVGVDCQFIPPDTIFCTYIWGNNIRVMIYKRDATTGKWELLFDSGWFQQRQKPTNSPRPNGEQPQPRG